MVAELVSAAKGSLYVKRDVNKMRYIRHSGPIWVRDCVVRTLGLLPSGIYVLCLREYRHVAPTDWIYIWFSRLWE